MVSINQQQLEFWSLNFFEQLITHYNPLKQESFKLFLIPLTLKIVPQLKALQREKVKILLLGLSAVEMLELCSQMQAQAS